MKQKGIQRLSIIFCAVGMLFWMLACVMSPVYAVQLGTLTLHYRIENKVGTEVQTVTLSNVSWNLYRVAEKGADGTWNLTEAFSDCPVSCSDLTTSNLQDTAATLENYAVLMRKAPLQSVVTDKDGMLTFSDLEAGYYLLSGERKVINGRIYNAVPFLIEMPSTDGNWNPVTYPKCRVRSVSSATELYTLQKIWMNDEEKLEERPSKISVGIYKDEQLMDTVEVTAENNWKFQWSGDADSEYRVLENDVAKDYRVIYRSNETQFAIVNSKAVVHSENMTTTATTTTSTTPSVITTSETTTSETDTQITTTTSEIDTQITTTMTTTPSTSATTSTTSRTTTIVTTTTTKNSGSLPKTGQLWWPVPILAITGAFMLMIGFRLRNTE